MSGSQHITSYLDIGDCIDPALFGPDERVSFWEMFPAKSVRLFTMIYGAISLSTILMHLYLPSNKRMKLPGANRSMFNACYLIYGMYRNSETNHIVLMSYMFITYLCIDMVMNIFVGKLSPSTWVHHIASVILTYVGITTPIGWGLIPVFFFMEASTLPLNLMTYLKIFYDDEYNKDYKKSIEYRVCSVLFKITFPLTRIVLPLWYHDELYRVLSQLHPSYTVIVLFFICIQLYWFLGAMVRRCCRTESGDRNKTKSD